MKYFFLSILLFCAAAFAQDSLYLVNTLTGDTDNRLFFVKPAGDINGDGYADLAFFYDDYTCLCFGNSNFELNNDLIINRLLTFPGDINDDGFDDFLFYKRNHNDYIKVFLGYGGCEIDTIGTLVYSQKYYNENLSINVDLIGDVNGDGYDDFAISSIYNWDNGISYVYLYLGGDSISSQPFVTFEHSPWIDPSSEGTFGDGVTGIGDQNNDGYDDLLISDPANNGVAGDSGRVYLYYGGTEMDSIADTIFTFKDIQFGSNVKNLGDINNDGSTDFAVTSYDSCVIYFSFDSILTTRFYGSGIGHGIGGNGDIDNDNISDFILGYIKGKEKDYSGMECYTGNQKIDLAPDYYAAEEQENSSFAQYTDFIGDFNGDGYDDIFVVANTFRKNDIEIGKLYVYSYKQVEGIKETKNKVIDDFQLFPNYPNPFNNRTIIPFKLKTLSEIQIAIYDIRGRLIKTLFSGSKPAGRHKIVWNGKTDSGKEAASGVYYIVLKQNNTNLNMYTQKIVLLK